MPGSDAAAGTTPSDAAARHDSGRLDAGGDAGKPMEAHPLDLPTVCNAKLSGDGMVKFGRLPVRIYMDPDAKQKPAPGGPLVFYWHATGTTSSEVETVFGKDNIDQVVAMGGVVASFESSPPLDGGMDTGTGIWFVEDFEIADEVLACAIRDANIDTRHIHALGFVPGGLQAVVMQLQRANYMASIIAQSGGLNPKFDSTNDPSNLSSALLAYGPGGEVFDWAAYATQYHDEQTPKGRFVMMCPREETRVFDPAVVGPSLRFFMDNGYKVASPYRNGHIPSDFPSDCTE
jgi:hypothetical protein